MGNEVQSCQKMTNQPFEFMNVSYPPVCCQGEGKGLVIEFPNFAECFCLQLTALYFTRTYKKVENYFGCKYLCKTVLQLL